MDDPYGRTTARSIPPDSAWSQRGKNRQPRGSTARRTLGSAGARPGDPGRHQRVCEHGLALLARFPADAPTELVEDVGHRRDVEQVVMEHGHETPGIAVPHVVV